jgi:hypothetical protein
MGTTTLRHTYTICISSNSDESKKLPDDGILLPKHVGACVLNKGVVNQFHSGGCFLLRLIMHGTNIKHDFSCKI